MKKTLKRTLSILLVIVVLTTILPVIAFANQGNMQNSSVETQVELSGNGFVGDMIAETIQTAQKNAMVANSATITSLTFNKYIAKVKFSISCSAKLVVAIYSEDGSKMLTSGILDVKAEETYGEVDVDTVTLPKYFLIKAFLLDPENNSALCEPYVCSDYTEAFEKFMSKTTEDFDDELVINFDDSIECNFGIVNAQATVVEETSSTNQFVSYDEETGSYTFKDIDDEIRGLKKGDIFCSRSDDLENIIFIKVKNIEISDNTATIVEDSASLTDFFDYLKLDTSKISKDTFTTQSVSWVDEGESYAFETKSNPLKKTFGSVTLTGDVTLSATLDFKVYIAKNIYNLLNWFGNNEAFVRFKITPSATITLTLSSKLSKSIQLASLSATLWGIVTVSVNPILFINFSGKITVTGTYTFAVGAQWHSEDGFVNLCEKPIFKPQIEIEGTFYVGIELEPMVYIINEKVLKLRSLKKSALLTKSGFF